MSPPPSSTPRPNAPARAPRPDGDATRGRILDIAGRLFAERGYADTTSKAICEAARTNMAAVNYHFGSREGLYAAVLAEVHRHLVSVDFATGLADGPLPPRRKLERFIEGICVNLLDIEGWQTRLWARELLAPSPTFAQVIHSEAMPKFAALRRVLAQVTGLPADDPALARCALSVMSPFLVLLISRRDLPGPAAGILDAGAEALAAHMKAFLWAGLRAVARP